MIFVKNLTIQFSFNNKVTSFPCVHQRCNRTTTTTQTHTQKQNSSNFHFHSMHKTAKFMLDALRGISCTFECTQNTIKITSNATKMK